MTDVNREHEKIFSALYREDVSPLICIGRDVEAGAGLCISLLFVSPKGSIAAVVPDIRCSDYVDSMKNWSADKLDEIASDYFFADEGQGLRIIDAMARCGYLTFSDEKDLAKNLQKTLNTGDILFMTDGG